MADWDYSKLTKYTFTKDLLRGTKNKQRYNDQLFIWCRREDYETLGKTMVRWYRAEEKTFATYKLITVTIELRRKYPMALVYKGGDPKAGELELTEYGNYMYADARKIRAYNNTVIDSWKFKNGFGKNVVKSQVACFNLGRRYERYVAMLMELGYVMVADDLSGLISAYEYNLFE